MSDCCNKALTVQGLFTESFRTTEGENLMLRWAKAFLHVAENLPIYVDPDYEL